jgi:hypothetical protein
MLRFREHIEWADARGATETVADLLYDLEHEDWDYLPRWAID